MTLEHLSQAFSVPGVRFEEAKNGLIKVVVQNGQASGELYLHGAHITHFQPKDANPVLWMSEHSMFESGKPIRGGVPICFPWFGPRADDPTAPGHGFARITEWSIGSLKQLSSGATEVVLQTKLPPFELTYCVTFGTQLTMALTVSLPATASDHVRFEEALHTYFTVGDVLSVRIKGLEQTAFLDKVDGGTIKPATGEPIKFDGECDRVYQETTETCKLVDTAMQRTIVVSKSNSRSTVVWNPWINKSAKMADFGDDEWPGMVCIETANVGPNAIELAPGKSHTMTAIVELEAS